MGIYLLGTSLLFFLFCFSLSTKWFLLLIIADNVICLLLQFSLQIFVFRALGHTNCHHVISCYSKTKMKRERGGEIVTEDQVLFELANSPFVAALYASLGVRVFANGPGDLGSIPGRVIPKTQKMVLDASLLSTQHYKVRIKGKVEQSMEGVAPSPTHWCSSYRKGSLRVTLDYGRQLYFLLWLIKIWAF